MLLYLRESESYKTCEQHYTPRPLTDASSTMKNSARSPGATKRNMAERAVLGDLPTCYLSLHDVHILQSEDNTSRTSWGRSPFYPAFHSTRIAGLVGVEQGKQESLHISTGVPMTLRRRGSRHEDVEFRKHPI
jgi:hypothetical protein